MKKQFLSIFLALCMMLTVFPTYALAANGAIQGTVVDAETQSPLEVTVTLYARDDMTSALATATSNASTGAYTIAPSGGISAGQYTLVFTNNLYLRKSMDIEMTSSDGLIIAAATGLYPVGQCDGTVTDAATGLPLSGVTVNVYQATSGDLNTSTTTGVDGKYSIETQAGVYNFEFVKSGYTATKLERVSLGAIGTTHDAQMTLGSGGSPGGGDDDEGNWTWSLEDGVLTISGTGKMAKFYERGAPWYGERAKIHQIIIEDGINSIGDNAFYDCNNLININISNTVNQIGYSAFRKCASLSSVIIPDGVTSIEGRAFQGCSSLTSINIPEKVTSIEEGLFIDCSSLTSIDLPKNITTIGNIAFWGCRALTSITIPESVTTIEYGAFRDCSSIVSISIPGNVTSIGQESFEGCNNLESIIVNSRNLYFASEGGVLFNKNKNELLCYPAGKIDTSYTIPNTVTTIANYSLTKCFNLSSIVMPYGVISIGDWAMAGCSNLTNITIPDSITSIGACAFYVCNHLNDVYYSGSEENWNALIIGNENTDLTSATIHYNSTDPDINPSEEITLRSDNDFTVCTDNTSILLASIPNAANLQKGDISWSSSNESVAAIESSDALISGSTASATAVIRGVSTGTTTITITLSDGRSANCTITVSSKPNEIQLSGMSTLFVGDITTATAKITLNVIDTTDSIEWSSSNRDVVAFDSNGAGNISRPIVGMTITDSQITDSVQLHARSSGAAKITCKLKSTGAEQSFNVSVITKQEAELQRLAMEWVRAYDEYNAKLKATLSEAASGDVNKRTLDEVAKEFEETLGKKYGLTVAATGTTTEQRVLVYKALLEMLAGYTSNQLALKNISFSNLDTVPVDICDEVLNALRNETYTYTDKRTGASVRILLSDYAGAKWGLASVWESGRSGSVDVAFSSSPSSVKAVIADYTSQLLELEKAALKKSAKEAVAALSRELLGKSISTLKEDFIRNKVSIYTEQFTKLGLGDVTGVLNSCYNYYKFIDKIIGGDFSELAGMLEGTKDIDFSNPNFTTNITKKVVSKLDSVQKEILKLLSKGVTGKEEWFSVKTPTSSSTFGCPVNIVVYDSQHNSVGYVGSDDLWFDESKIYIEQNGETKVIYSAGEALTFDITATDYGTLNCTFEEYSSSSAISRVNYYDILLYAGKEIRAKIPGNNFNEYTVTVSSEEGTISADEIIPGTDYLSATVTIVCSADSVDGGQIYGSGQYVRGDPVKLFAMTENDYRFLGWQNNDGDLVSVDPVYEFTAKEDIALTALFTKQSSGENPPIPVIYTITFDANGGIVSSAPMTTNADGRLITLPIPSRVGYIFNGWYTAPTGGTRITTDTVFTENSTVYAHWTYTGSNGGSTPGSGSPSGSSNFSNGNSSSNTISIPIITGGKISVNPKSAAKGTTITITVTPDSGYELDRLTVTDADGNELTLTDKGNGKFIFTMPASKVEITASFKKIATPNEQPEHPSTPYPFTDVPAGVWYSDAVQYVYDMGMMAGITSTTFGPEVTTNRGMIVTMLYRLEGEPSVGTANFTDVPAGEWYSAAVTWAETNGIVNGTTATTFEPLVPITRQQMAAILYRYANYKGYNVGAQTDLSSFDDANQVDPYALTAMQWANTEGLITGTTSTTLAPNGDATRAQVATIMMRFCKNVAK